MGEVLRKEVICLGDDHFCSFYFNLLCVGETGIGKTTLMESLFNMPLDFQPCNAELSTVELRQKAYGERL